MEEFIDKASLEIFLKENVINLIEKRKIQWTVSKETLIRYIITGTMKLARIYEKMNSTVYLKGPYVRHDDFQEDYEYWEHLFDTSFWLDIAEKVEKYLLFPNDFSQRWVSHLNEWLYCFINPENSYIFQEYYSREPDEDTDVSEKGKIDPYLIDYKGDHSYV